MQRFLPLRCVSAQSAKSFPILLEGRFFLAYFDQESLENFRGAGISRDQVVHHAGAVSIGGHQIRNPQPSEVARDHRLGEPQDSLQIANTKFSRLEHIQDPQAGGLRNRLQKLGQAGRRSLLVYSYTRIH